MSTDTERRECPSCGGNGFANGNGCTPTPQNCLSCDGFGWFLTPEGRQALIRKPYPITYILPVKRWGGVQVAPDDGWDQVTERYHLRRNYADRFEVED